MDEARKPTDDFITTTPHALVVSDEQGQIVEANHAAERLLAYGPGELIGLGIEDLVPVELRTWHAAMRRCSAADGGGQSHDTSYRREVMRKDGTRIRAVISLAPLHADGGLRHEVFIMDDEASRRVERQADQEHRAAFEAGDLSQAIIRAASLGIILYDASSGQCESANDAAVEFTGVSREVLLSQRFYEIGWWKPSGLLDAAEAALATGKLVSRDVETLSPAGRRLALICKCLVITLRDRPHLVLMMDNLTERRNLEAQLLAAQKMEAIGQLAGGVAHDFNNLLTVIGTYCALMLEGCPPDDARKEDLEEIQSAAKRAATLTRQLLAFGRRQSLKSRLVDLNAIISDLEKMLRRVLSAEIAMCIVPDKSLGLIYADAGQIEQVLMNLVVNARDAMPSGGLLTIATANVSVVPDSTPGADAAAGSPRAPADMVMLCISDTGTGMDEETAARVFEPFFTTKEPGRGSGLGLSTTYGIVKQSGGFVRMRSRIGEGTTFELFFPRHLAIASNLFMPSGAVDPDQNGDGEILVVEDDEHVRRIVVTALLARGYTVCEAANGEEALGVCLARSEPPDLLVTDVIMPRMNGRELVKRLRVRWPKLRVLFMTAYTLEEETDRTANELLGALLHKPFVPGELAHAVRHAMRGTRT